MHAITYVAGSGFVCEDGKPTDAYLHRIMTGAKHHALPDEYIHSIERLAR